MNKLKKILFIIGYVILLFVLQAIPVFAAEAAQTAYPVFNDENDFIIAPPIEESGNIIVAKNQWGTYYRIFDDDNGYCYITQNGYLSYVGSSTVYTVRNDAWTLMVHDGSFTSTTDNINGDFGCKLCFKMDIYGDVDKSYIFYQYNYGNQPRIANTDENLQNINTSNDYLLIFPNDFFNNNLRFALRVQKDEGDYISETNLKVIELNENSPFLKTLNDEKWFEIPFSEFSGIVLQKGTMYNWLLAYDLNNQTKYVDRYLVSNVDFKFTSVVSGGGSTENNDNINTNAIIESQAQTTDAVKESTNAIKEQTEAINENNNFIKDDSISDDNFVLPDDSSNDISKQGIENIFDLLYNSFTSGEAQDIVLPVPFTGKNIVIPSDYLENIFNNSNFNFLLMFIHAFYYFIVSSFIVIDIQKKFDKIKSGNIENLQNDNIKADML